ncbi:hypothetical protein QF000_006070 [Paraburkholderia atlantica]
MTKNFSSMASQPRAPAAPAPSECATVSGLACHRVYTILTIIATYADAPRAPARYRVGLRFFSGPTYGVMPACK